MELSGVSPFFSRSEILSRASDFVEFHFGNKTLKIKLAEGVGFEPTLGLLLSLISSQVPSTTQPPFRTNMLRRLEVPCF